MNRWAGATWVPGRSVGGVLREHRDVVAAVPYAMVTVVDSGRDVAAMPWARGVEAVRTEPFVVTGAALAGAAEAFAGFDEVWLLAEPYGVAPPVTLVQPSWSRPSRELGTWVRRSRCLLGMGDGYGVAYVSADAALTRALGLPPASPPSRPEVVTVIDELVAGRVSREHAASWAAAALPDDGAADETLGEALEALFAMADPQFAEGGAVTGYAFGFEELAELRARLA